MKIWLLRPIDGDSLWDPWYDKAFGFVVRAESEAEARALALTESGDEVRGWGADPDRTAWEPAHSTCIEVTPDGAPGIVMRDFKDA